MFTTTSTAGKVSVTVTKRNNDGRRDFSSVQVNAHKKFKFMVCFGLGFCVGFFFKEQGRHK